MSKIICPCVVCKYNGEDNVCDAEEIRLTFRKMHTVNEGVVDMWVCDKYEMSDYSKRIQESMKQAFDNWNMRYNDETV